MQQLIKHGNSNLRIDLKSNQLTFLDSRFYVTESGNYVPSVTTYLEAYPKGPQYYEWLKRMGEDADEIRDEAGRRGSIVHGLTEEYDNGMEVSLLDENGYIGYKLSEWAMFERYVEFRNNHPIDILHTELNMVSDEQRMGGTIDRIITLKGKTFLIDIKTSSAIHPHYWLQLEAYTRLWSEYQPTPIDGVAILWLNAKTRTEGRAGAIQGKGWQLVMCTDAEERAKNWKLFQACQQLWLAENEEQKPRQLTYSLSHAHNKKEAARA